MSHTEGEPGVPAVVAAAAKFRALGEVLLTLEFVVLRVKAWSKEAIVSGKQCQNKGATL